MRNLLVLLVLIAVIYPIGADTISLNSGGTGNIGCWTKTEGDTASGVLYI